MLTSPNLTTDDNRLDITLRPYNFHDYIGQNKIKENLKILIEAARQRKQPIEHVLLHGSSGLGKTSLAYVIAHEIRTNIKTTSGPAIEKIGDLASILTNLNDYDILFIDECHRLNKLIEETLYPAMEDYKLDIIIGKGPSARTLQLELPRFTLIGATTRISLLSSPLRNRFGAIYHLNFYEPADIEKIIIRSSQILNINIEPKAVKLIACCARSTPRVANRLLKRVRDYAQVKSNGQITAKIAQEALDKMEIDQLGLEPTDRNLLKVIIEKFQGGPVGLKTLAAATNEEPNTIEEIYEPYLLQAGLIHRTPQGRIATPLSYEHLGLTNFKLKNTAGSKQEKLI